MDEKQIENDIISLLRNHGHKAFRPKEMARALDYRDNRDYRLFREVLARLDAEGRIARIKGGRYTFRKRPRQAAGILNVSSRGFGLVRLEEDDAEVFVSPFNMGAALHGDRVEVKLLAPAEGNRRREARVEQVLERHRTRTVGTIDLYDGFGLVTSDDQRILQDIRVAAADLAGARPGDKVVVSIDRYEDPDAYPEGRILEVLGRSGDPRVDDLAIAMSFGLEPRFPDAAAAEAAQIRLDTSPEALEGRLDLRNELVFTIDPENARDFDDAIHVNELPDGQVEVGVHIADVSHYVRPGSELDQEAFRRATSVYMVSQVIPMLPEELSNEICSLAQGVDRLTFSVIMRLNADGEVTSYDIRESVIRSARRMNYAEAEALIHADPDAHAGDAIVGRLRLAARIAGGLTRRRMASGSIDFDTPEVRIVLDQDGRAVDVIRKQRLSSHRLIEEFMLLANRTVATYAASLTPEPAFVYRVHGYPDRERIAALAEYVGVFGMSLHHKAGKVESSDLNALLEQARGRPQEPVIENAVLRAMAKAHYTPNNIGHFGLGFEKYTHFTSPIRRYPDLLVHRHLKLIRAGRPQSKSDHEDELARRSDHCSEMERLADSVERESTKAKQVEFLQEHIGEQHVGIVTGITSFGAFVELEEWLIEGLVHVRDMEDFYEHDERRFALIGSKGNQIQVGDEVEVIIVEADPETRQVDFVFAPGSSR